MKRMTTWLLAAVVSAFIWQTSVVVAAEVIVYSSEEMIDFMAEKFEEKYPDIKVRIVLGSSGELSARMVAEGSNPQGDVFWGGGSIELTHPELFRPVTDLDIGAINPQLPSYDLKVPIQIYAGVYIVNHDLLGGEPTPTTWAELADPKWKGKFYFGNPVTSHAAFTIMMTWYQIGGWELVEKIAANAIVTQGSVDPVRGVGNGEATIGAGVERVAYDWSDGEHVRVVYPQDGVIMLHGDLYITKGGPNEEEARTFVNFMLSAEAQEAMSEEFKGTRPTNIHAKVGGGLVETSKLNLLDFPEGVETDRKVWVDKWKDIIASVR